LARVKQRIQLRHRLHQLNAVHFVFKTLVDLDEGDDATRDQRLRGGLAIDFAVHRAFEQDRADHLVAGEGRCGDDAAAHLVDQAEHLRFARIQASFSRRHSPASAFGVEPPDWSSAAMKPLPAAILLVISSSVHLHMLLVAVPVSRRYVPKSLLLCRIAYAKNRFPLFGAMLQSVH
jgi:hypothetical protein